MDYKKIAKDEYDIHFIKNNDFHTIEFYIMFTENVSKEKITYRNALIDVLTYATKKYDTKEKLIRKCQDLYSLRPIVSSRRNGNVLVTKFGISTIDAKCIEKENLYENILLLKEIILNPLVIDNAFSNKYFNIVKENLIREIKTIVEEPRLYANLELLKLLDNKSDKILSGYCDLKILGEMDEKILYKSYLDLLQNSKIDIFISGNYQGIDEIVKVITDNFVFNNHYLKIEILPFYHPNKRSIPIIKEEIGNYQQSKLSMGFKLYDLTEFENRYVSFIFNGIFGGGADSILSRNVREKNSLCYYILSYVNRLDNILVINSGIDKENEKKVLELIKEALNDMENGLFTDKDIEKAKMEVLFELSNIWENNRNIIDYYYGKTIFNSDELNTRTQMIKKVSREDIIAFSKKINLDAIFFLKGDL